MLPVTHAAVTHAVTHAACVKIATAGRGQFDVLLKLIQRDVGDAELRGDAFLGTASERDELSCRQGNSQSRSRTQVRHAHHGCHTTGQKSSG